MNSPSGRSCPGGAPPFDAVHRGSCLGLPAAGGHSCEGCAGPLNPSSLAPRLVRRRRDRRLRRRHVRESCESPTPSIPARVRRPSGTADTTASRVRRASSTTCVRYSGTIHRAGLWTASADSIPVTVCITVRRAASCDASPMAALRTSSEAGDRSTATSRFCKPSDCRMRHSLLPGSEHLSGE